MRPTHTHARATRAGIACRGFSLIELTLVVAMIAVLGVLAAPRFASASARQRTQAAANRIEADLALAQQRARAASADYTVRFKGDCYQLIAADGTVDQLTDLAEDPYRIDLGAILDDKGSDLVFNGYGLPSTGATITAIGGGLRIALKVDPTTGEVTRP